MTAMNIDLPRDMLDFIEDMARKDGYPSSGDVVLEALRRMRADMEAERFGIEPLRREVQIGLDAAQAGRFSKETVADIAGRLLSGKTRP